MAAGGPTVMIYVQHLMGIGHQRRAALISRQLCAKGADVTYVSGGCPVPDLDVGGARFIQLPPARAADLSYRTLVDERGQAVTEQWKAARRQALLQTFGRSRPRALLIETFPFGRGLLRFELLPLVEAARAGRISTRLSCSVRDIIEPRSPARAESIAGLVESHFHQVLVHSDPEIIRFEESFPLAGRIASKVRYTGFVADLTEAKAVDPGAGRDAVVVSAGGGIVGERLLGTAMRARQHSSLRAERWRLLAGPGMSAARFRALREQAPAGVVVERNRTDFAELLRGCTVSVSQAGYNTLLDVVRARARAVVVPFTDGRHVEQPARARLFAKRGLVGQVLSEKLGPETLARAVDLAARSEPTSPGVTLDLDGAARTAELVLASIRA